MKFSDVLVNRKEMFSIGIEETTGRFYASFPVSNGMIEYEEYYVIDQASFDLFRKDSNAALAFVMKCRHREMDERLMIQPGARRGWAGS